MSVKLISGPWESGNSSQRARKEAHVTRDIVQPPNTRETVSRRLVDSLGAQYYFDDDSVLSDSVLTENDTDDPGELRSILESCRRLRPGEGKTSSRDLQNLQKRVTFELDLPEWPCSLVDWGLLPERKYQLKPSARPVSKSQHSSQRTDNSAQSKTVESGRSSCARPKSNICKRKDAKTDSPLQSETNGAKKVSSQESNRSERHNPAETESSTLSGEPKTDELSDVKLHDVLNSLTRESSQYLIQKKHSATRVRVLEDTHKNNGLVASTGSLVLKEARRYRRPYHSSANLPITVSKEVYQSAEVSRPRSDSTASGVLLQQYQPKLYTPVERALQRRSASYAAQVRRIRSKESAVNKVQSFQLQPSQKRPMSLPRLTRRSVTWAASSPTKTDRKQEQPERNKPEKSGVEHQEESCITTANELDVDDFQDNQSSCPVDEHDKEKIAMYD